MKLVNSRRNRAVKFMQKERDARAKLCFANLDQLIILLTMRFMVLFVLLLLTVPRTF